MNQKFTELKNWILSQKIPNVIVEDKGENILFKSKKDEACVKFHELDFLIVEMSVKK